MRDGLSEPPSRRRREDQLQAELEASRDAETSALAARRAAEQAAERLRLVLRVTSDAIWDWDLGTDTVSWNEGLHTAFGYPAGGVPPSFAFWKAGVHPGDRERVLGGLRAAVESGAERWSDDYRFRRADGGYTQVHHRALVQHDEAGRPLRVIGALQDVMERSRAEIALAEQVEEARALGEELETSNEELARAHERAEGARARLERIFAAAPAVMALYTGPDHVITYVNPTWVETVGKPDAVGRPFREVFPEFADSGLFEELDRVYATGEPYENSETVVPLVRWGSDVAEETVWNLVWLPLEPGEGDERDILVHAVEVTDQIRARALVEEERDRTWALLESTTEGIYGIDLEGRCTFINRAAAAMLGYAPDELLGRNMHAAVHHTREDGSPYPEAECPIRQSSVLGRPMRLADEVLWRSDGTSFRAEYASSPLVRDGRVHGAVVTVRDISERAEAEALRLALYEEGRRARAEADSANVAKSQFLANMSHEIRTPINAIIGYTDLLEAGIAGPLTDRQQDYLGRVRTSSQHLLGLVNDILDLSKVEAGEMTVERSPVHARGILAAAMSLVSPQALAREIELVRDEDCGAGATFFGDEDRVRQILVNLLSNAVKFTDPGGRVAVRCCGRSGASAGGAPAGEESWLTFEVEDTGSGIPPEELERIFEPFAQVEGGHTRSKAGTGLGLTISRRFARLMGGDLSVRSELGRGSCFTLWLPGEAQAAAAPTESGGWPSGPREVPGLTDIGHLLAERADVLTRALGDRLRADAEVPGARGLNRAQLEDHIATFLLDLGKSLVTLDEGGGEPALMSDSASIQRLISLRHGEQRRRVGWTAGEVRREYALLREEVDALLAGEASLRALGDVDAARSILHRLLDRSLELGLAGFEGTDA